jgi:hypothetical protein
VALLPAAPDVKAWRVLGLIFESREAAAELARIANSLTGRMERYYLGGQYTYGGPEGLRPDGSDTPVEIREDSFWSPANYDRHRVALERHKATTEAHKKAREEWEAIRKGRATIAESVNEAIERAYEDKRDRERVTAEFDRYVSLADGDRDTALRFYLAATKYDPEFVRGVVGMPADVDVVAR